jgi:hypothetical protein
LTTAGRLTLSRRARARVCGWLGCAGVTANAAAKALGLLLAKSDALALHLVQQLSVWPVDPHTISVALTLRDPAPLALLLQHAAAAQDAAPPGRGSKAGAGAGADSAALRQAQRARDTALAVLGALQIEEGEQASVCLSLLPSHRSGAMLSEPLLRWFHACADAEPRWHLPDSLHVQVRHAQLPN